MLTNTKGNYSFVNLTEGNWTISEAAQREVPAQTGYNETSGGLIADNLTDINGFYEFQFLTSGNYNVTEVLQSNWNNVTPISQEVTISNIDMQNINFTNQKLFNISGYKNDTNGNGLTGWNITVYNATTSSFVTFDLTDANGFYEFPNLAPGDYNVTEVLQDGYNNVTPISQIVIIGPDANLNFTNHLITFNISGYKIDTNGNGLAGWNITLYNATTSSFIAFDLTDANGSYEFPNLVPGAYNVTEVLQGSWTNVTPISQIVTIGPDAVLNFTNRQLKLPVPATSTGGLIVLISMLIAAGLLALGKSRGS